MYRALSPIFDAPEFPPLRRVKPLPKRRRTSETLHHDDADNVAPAALTVLGSSPTAKELLAHADAVAAQAALQSYYMPMLEGVQELYKGDLTSRTSTPIDLSGGYGLGDSRGHEDDDAGDGDYIDHLQQPGNTKKRKVPANMSGSLRGGDAASGGAGDDEEPTDRAIPTGARSDRDYDAAGAQPPPPSPGTLVQKKGKLHRATWAGLQHKEMLKSRKRQLAAVLGALSHGDTLALDQALCTSYPFATAGLFGDPKLVRVRLSRRRGPRLARGFRAFHASLPSPPDGRKHVTLRSSDFSFICHSAASDRLVATRDEVAVLHARFEQELARQAAKAAEAAKQAAAALGNGPFAKRNDNSKHGRGGHGVDPNAGSLDQSPLGGKDRGKKKKRAALANASNPHHLRNYVPSRLPNQGQANAAKASVNNQNLVSPLPLRFLSAEIPPRRRKSSERVNTPVSTLNDPADEWICPFCEYSLFYGDELGFQRAVRNRKKILRRRRRARERAAAAASGSGPVMASEKNTPVNEEAHAGYDVPAGGDNAPAAGKQGRHKDERDRGGGTTGCSAIG